MLPSPPLTDPDVRNSRIRFFTGEFRSRWRMDAVRDSPGEKRTEAMMAPPSYSPVRLSVVVSWTGSRSPKSPPVFPGNGSHPVAPPFPRAGPGEPSSPRSAVL